MPVEPGASAGPETRQEPSPYAWYLLAVLVLVYVFNYIDRQLLTILAPEIKRDLGISDADFGFLYGTAFGVFYALFGIPLGRFADRWSRIGLLSFGLGLWSLMTALSGFSRNFAQIAAARVGIGIGEATAQPCAFSLIGDYFPPHRRATALGIYSIGLFVGGGVSLFLGSAISTGWNAAYPPGQAPLGLAGWQAAFVLIGLPGLLLSAWVATLREPRRGAWEAPTGAPPPRPREGSPWAALLREFGDIAPPFTLIGAARRGTRALLANLLVGLGMATAAVALARATGDTAQWAALGIGGYAVVSWVAATRAADAEAYALFKSRPFLGVTLGYGTFAFIAYANIAFTPLYAIQELGADPAAAGLALGGIGGLGGVGGVVLGGVIADRLARRGGHARRVALTMAGAAAATAAHAVMFSAGSLPLFYAMVFAMQLGNSIALVGASGTIVNITPPHLRGAATAAFLLAGNMIGLGLGPYTAGKMSAVLGGLGDGMLTTLLVAPVMLLALALAHRALRKDVSSA